MTAFERLGLPRQADVTQVKRAYAKLLRAHRPDDAPIAFQSLHEAYKACMDQARWRQRECKQGHGDETAHRPLQHDPGAHGLALTDTDQRIPAHAHSTEVNGTLLRFDPDVFARELIAAARNPSLDIRAWLDTHEDLYSVDNKDTVADMLVGVLHDNAPIPPRKLASLLGFFELDVVNDRYLRNERAIERLRADSATAHGEIDLSFMNEQRQRARPARQEVSWGWIIWALILVANAARHLVES